MDILILDSWLREFLDTKAKPAQIAKYLTLCGPSVERISKSGNNDFIYHIEVTTNRIDTASVYGIAREAAAILPRFNIKAKLKPVRSESKQFLFSKTVRYLNITVNKKICSRFTTALIRNVKIGDSPDIVKKRLQSANIRPINNIVDISNYIMLELGQPVHTFDYDKIGESKMILRESHKGEKITTLDGKEFTLPGGDIVIEDGKRRLIDLAGIMGGALSAVDKNTKNILLFVQTYNPTNIRKTSMALAQRTQAASIFEKGTDEELVAPAILSAINMFKEETHATADRKLLDFYPNPYKPFKIITTLEYINTRLGVQINKKDIGMYLKPLGFEYKWSGNTFTVFVPSWRSKDIKAKEDILEEISRIYGYYNLPSKIMDGDIPERPEDPAFTFEGRLRDIISGFGGTEVYTLALVPKDEVDEKHVKLKNPLGPETEHMRTSLRPSLKKAAQENVGTLDEFHLFELANVYLPKKSGLPEERLIVAGIFNGYEYRKAKGIVEALLERLHIKYTFKSEESKGFGASKCAYIYSRGESLGKIGYLENSNLIYYEFEANKLMKLSPKIVSFKPISKYPSQNEDVTLHIPERTHIMEVISFICSLNNKIQDVSFVGEYNNNYTLHIKYHDPKKTLTNEEVEKIRGKIISSVKSKFGAIFKG